jgi:PAS domain S-box-containing protein
MSEAHYRAVVEQTPDAVIVADRQGVIELWNRAAEAIFGHTAGEAVGKSLDVIIPERLRAGHWAGYDRALESGSMKYAGRVLTTRSMHKDGRTLYVDLAFALLRDDSGAIVGAIATARDCTEAYLAKKASR